MIINKRLISFVTFALVSLFTLYWFIASSVLLSTLPTDSSQGLPLISRPPQESSPSPEPFDFSKTHKDIQGRVRRVSELCEKYHLGRFQLPNGTNDLALKEPPTPLFSYYFVNKERGVSWCPVYKAGSTSWLQNMMILARVPESQVLHPPKPLSSWARDLYPPFDIGSGSLNDSLQLLGSSLKLLVVRHPFERLVSAYKDKLSNASSGHEHGTHFYYKKYGAKIVKKFRTSPLPQMEPTWTEFVTYLTSTDLLQYSDDHWLPAYYSCTPCLVPYDVIAKTETYLRDQEYVIHKAGLKGLLHPKWSHSSTSSAKERATLSSTYFAQLPKHLIHKLYLKYFLDFDLFGYSHKAYLHLGYP